MSLPLVIQNLRPRPPVANPYEVCRVEGGIGLQHTFSVGKADFVRCMHCGRNLDIEPYDLLLRRLASDWWSELGDRGMARLVRST